MTGSCIRKRQTHSSKAEAMAISSDGCTAVSALPDGNIIIAKTNEDVPSRIVNCRESGRGRWFGTDMDLTANGQWAVVAVPSEEKIKILNTSTEELSIIPAGDRAFAVAWSADGDWVASGDERGIQIWERQAGQLVRETEFKLPGYSDAVRYVSFSADKKLLAAGSPHDISVWNTTTGALTWTIDYSHAGDINSISFSPDSKRIVSASFPQTIQVWDFSIVEEAAYHPPGYGYGLRFSDKDHFIGQYPDSSLRMWGNTGGPSTFHGLWPTGVAISQDKKRLAWSDRGVITIWDVENVKIILKICCRAGHVVYNERDPQVDESQRTNHDIADLECTQCEPEFLGLFRSSEGCHGMAFRDNYELATCFYGLIKIWSIFDGSSVQILDSGTNFVPDMTFSSNSRLLACIAQNIQYEAYSTDGYQDSTTGDDPNRPSGEFIQIWDTATEQCTSISLPDTTITQGYFLQSLSFSADMQLIAAAGGRLKSFDPSVPGIGVWDVKSGSLLRFFKSERLTDITARFDTRIAGRLHTEYGFIDVTRYLDETNTGLGCADSDVSEKDLKEVLDAGTQEAMPSFSGYGLSFNRQWIVRDGKRLLWIPPDFRIGYCMGQGLTPVIDGLSIAWLREVRSPVRMYFIDQE